MSNLRYADVVDDSILVYVEDHQTFLDWITEQTGGGSDRMDVDLAKGQITYQPKLHKRNEVIAPVHLIGTVAGSTNSALWAWANPAFSELPVSRLVTRVRDFGQNSGVTELTEAEIPVADNANARLAAATRMAAVSCRITGFSVGQLMSAQDTHVVMVVDAAGFQPARPSGVTFPGLLTGTIAAEGFISDHRRAVQGYAQARGLRYGWGEGFTSINLGFPEGMVSVHFDEHGRVGNIHTNFDQPQQ